MVNKLIKRNYKQGSPERAITGFINAWKNKDWLEMAKYCQLTWRIETSLDYQPFELEQRFGAIKLRSARIQKVFMQENLNSNVITEVELKVHHLVSEVEGMFCSIFKFRLLKESGLREPDIKGEWGVNIYSFTIDRR